MDMDTFVQLETWYNISVFVLGYVHLQLKRIACRKALEHPLANSPSEMEHQDTQTSSSPSSSATGTQISHAFFSI
ncbi:hypothetical protein DM860_006712 [Cuscuta australis]|uniref:Uncharacterized protein n=1 Tax=Cuscuta australis TaxID=267555 RepID=A0A328D4B4_9ASTE|nr:hypothetical protein DM860_006712 [Cuscuta australis]